MAGPSARRVRLDRRRLPSSTPTVPTRRRSRSRPAPRAATGSRADHLAEVGRLLGLRWRQRNASASSPSRPRTPASDVTYTRRTTDSITLADDDCRLHLLRRHGADQHDHARAYDACLAQRRRFTTTARRVARSSQRAVADGGSAVRNVSSVSQPAGHTASGRSRRRRALPSRRDLFSASRPGTSPDVTASDAWTPPSTADDAERDRTRPHRRRASSATGRRLLRRVVRPRPSR
jgi:hypothetical protein